MSYEERRQLEREEKDQNLVAGIHLQERPGEHPHPGVVWEGEGVEDGTPVDLRRVTPSAAPPIGDGDGGGGPKPSPPDLHAGPPSLRRSLTPPPSGASLRALRGSLTPSSTSTVLPAARERSVAGASGKVRGKPWSLAEDPRPPQLKQRTLKVSLVPTAGPAPTLGRNQHGAEDPPPVEEVTPASTSTQPPPRPTEPRSTAAQMRPSAKSAKSTAPPKRTTPSEQRKTKSIDQWNKAVQAKPTALPVTQPAANATTLRKAKLDQLRRIKGNKNKGSTTKPKPEKGPNGNKGAVPTRMAEVTTTPYFPYFKDAYCPPECACYGG